MMKVLDLAFVSSMGLAFCSVVNSIQFMPTIVSYGIVFCWMLVAFAKFVRFSKFKYYGLKEQEYIACSLMFKYNNYVRVAIYIYTVMIISLGLSEKRFLSTNLQTFINGLSAISVVYIFKERALKNSVIALIIAYFISLFYGLTHSGGLSVQILSNILEMHDIAFSIGVIFLYFLCLKKRWTVKNLKYELISFIIFALAFKRIGILALIFALILWKCGEIIKNKKKLIAVVRFITIVFCSVFIWLVMSGVMWNFIGHGMFNLGGRDYYYQILSNKYDYGITFGGIGRNAMQVILAEDYPYFGIGNIHSDILKMYVECGFILFYIWMLNYLKWLPDKVEKYFGKKTSLFVFVIVIYMFILYLTDNVETYIDTQYFFILVLVNYLAYVSSRTDKKYKTRLRFRRKRSQIYCLRLSGDYETKKD